MNHIYKALRQAKIEAIPSLPLYESSSPSADLIQRDETEKAQLLESTTVKPLMRPENRLVTLSNPNDLGTEKFRLLRARLRHIQDKGDLKKILVTSPVPGDGKTIVASNLAVSLSRNTTQKILLLEGDLRHPALADRFGLSGLPGLTDWFKREDPLTHFIYRVEGLELWFLPAGGVAEDALKILQSRRFSDAMDQVAAYFDWIVIDAPPLEPLADVHVWAEKSDGLLLVIRDGKTSKKALLKGISSLNGTRVLGVVFNDCSSVQHSYYQKYYGGNGNGKNKGNSTNGAGS